jgi:hypothetical protein
LGYETDALYTEKIKEVPFEAVKDIGERYPKGAHHCVLVSPNA